MQRWLKHKVTGEVFGWSEFLETNNMLYEVSEEEALPEKFAKPRNKNRKKADIDMGVDVPEAPPVPTEPKMAEAASAGLPGEEVGPQVVKTDSKVSNQMKKAFGAQT